MKLRRGIILAVVLGALTTVIASWALVIDPPQPSCWFTICRIGPPDDNPPIVRIMHESVASPERRAFVEWYYVYPSEASGDMLDAFAPTQEPAWRLNSETLPKVRDTLEREFERPMLPSWFRMSTSLPNGAIGYLCHSSGWPFRSMRSFGWVEGPGKPFQLSWSVRFRQPRSLPPSASRVAPSDGTLPLQPIPVGFALNTLIFAGAWWLILRGPRDVRAWLRRRRNQCAKCAYSRECLPEGIVCPESGAAVTA